jgi:xylan 1,4-beta-xylosidase
LIRDTIKKIKIEYNKEIDIIISEWNSSAYPKDLTHDTRYMSTFIIDTILNNFNTVQSLVYWTSVETRVSSEIFYGGLGLFTVNGIKKPSYNAFLLLNKLGKTIIDKGENYIVTSSNKNTYQILIYNFVYFNRKYLEGDFKSINLINRKNAFENLKPIENILTLNNISSGNYSIKKYTLNEENGSSYDAWIKMGAPKNITGEIFQYLKSKEQMKLEFFNMKIDSSLTLKDTLKSQDIILYKIEIEL